VLTHSAVLEGILHDGAALRHALIAEGWSVDVTTFAKAGD
jgi:hypothetical protein